MTYLIYDISNKGVLRVTFFDVGQGDAIFVETPSGKQMLIDGGAHTEIVKLLAKKMNYFDNDIDVVVATHNDADHVTGLIPVFSNYDISHVVTSPLKGESSIYDEVTKRIDEEVAHGATLHVAKKGDEINFGDGVVAYVVYPTSNLSPTTETNDASVSLLLVYKEHSYLFTGDLSQEYESRVITKQFPKNITVYKAGHHGSNTSSSELLLSKIRPEYAVISAGKDNRYGHPHKETLERLQKYAKGILSTANKGTITFTSDGALLTIETTK